MHQHGPAFVRNTSIADKFASEWLTIRSVTYRTAPPADLPSAVHGFVRIPAGRILTAADNQALLGDFTEADVLSAIVGLSCHKSAVSDGLNNDFYKDTAALLVPALVGLEKSNFGRGESPTLISGGPGHTIT